MDNRYKMYFNTGVKPYNRPVNSLGEFQVWKDGTMQIEFWLEHAPQDGSHFKFACDNPELPESQYMEVIPIVAGGLFSKYAYFINYKAIYNVR